MTEKKTIIKTIVWVIIGIAAFALCAVMVYNLMPEYEDAPTYPVADTGMNNSSNAGVNDSDSSVVVTIPPETTETTTPITTKSPPETAPATTDTSIDENGDEWIVQTNTPEIVTSAPETSLLDTQSIINSYLEIETEPPKQTESVTDRNGLPTNPSDGQEAVNKDGLLVWWDSFQKKWKPVGDGMGTGISNSPEYEEWLVTAEWGNKFGE